MDAAPKSTKWVPGQSGNPRGRKPGTGKVAKVRDAIGKAMPDILAAMVRRAKDGDPQAARLLMERTIPALKPLELPVTVAIPEAGGLVERAESILLATARGEIAPSQGAALLTALQGVARLVEIEELEQRIAALEETTR